MSYEHWRRGGSDADSRAQVLRAVRREIRAVDDQLPIMTLKTLKGHIRDRASLWMVRLGATIFSAFGALALFLAVVGVYGVKAYTVAQRTREIGIRKALGATSRDTLWLIVKSVQDRLQDLPGSEPCFWARIAPQKRAKKHRGGTT